MLEMGIMMFFSVKSVYMKWESMSLDRNADSRCRNLIWIKKSPLEWRCFAGRKIAH